MRGYHLLRTAWTIAADYLFDLFLPSLEVENYQV